MTPGFGKIELPRLPGFRKGTLRTSISLILKLPSERAFAAPLANG